MSKIDLFCYEEIDKLGKRIPEELSKMESFPKLTGEDLSTFLINQLPSLIVDTIKDYEEWKLNQ